MLNPFRGQLACVALLLFAACISLRLGYGFTVDDALISTRVAYHLSELGRYVFNREGPLVDCVTPLGWAWLLAPWSGDGALSGLKAARWFGILCALLSAGLVGLLLRPASGGCARPSWMAVAIVTVCLALNLPFGAWGSSGMETSLVTLLCTLSVYGSAHAAKYSFWCASAAAGLRPELLPWAFVLALFTPVQSFTSTSSENETTGLTRLLRVACVLCLPLLAALIRQFVFGSPAPLAIFAKPSDISHGLTYAWGGLRLLGIPVLLLGARSWFQVPSVGRATALAACAHLGAVIVAGGDWMSLFRLLVPVLPGLLWCAYLVLRGQALWVQALKALIALVPTVMLQVSLGQNVRQLFDARTALIREFEPLLTTSRSVATLDVGWVGAATEARITDFAGVTDPELAHLPGGHTSKQLPLNLLERRQVDTLILLLAPAHPPVTLAQPVTSLRFARVVENRAVRLYGAEEFVVAGRITIPGTDNDYLVLRRPVVTGD